MTAEQLVNCDKYYYLHSVCDITTLPKEDQIEIIDQLLEKLENKKCEIINSESEEYYMFTPICVAIKNYNLKVVQHLIGKFQGIDILTKCGKNVDHPIHIAASVGSIEILDLLLDLDKNSNIIVINIYLLISVNK
jgi:ankyrin repeat protein